MDIKADSHTGYHTFTHGVGSFEVFWEADKGWMWQPCFPGCLPDGEANGPFDTSLDAWADARAE